LPADIAQMLKGPWYDSAQLVLLKFGTDSEQWTQMSKATDTLLDSVQILEGEPDGRRQHLFRVVTLLPKELKRWLLSLQHDTGAVDDAVGLVEFAHLCVLRQSPLETESIPPLPLPEGVLEEEGEEENQPESGAAQVGQWYWILREGEAPLRARVIFELKSERRLLFANRAGMEVLRLGREEFSNLVDNGCAIVLQRGASYSRALAAAAGITCEEDLQGLPKAASTEALATDSPAPEGQDAAALSEEEEQARLWQEWEEARARQQGPGTESQANETG
jgi:hypothetical protein